MALIHSRDYPRPPELLAVSFAFPPLALPRSIQVARLLKHLPTSTVLVCCDQEEGIRKDSTIEPDAEPKLRKCLRVPFSHTGWGRLANKVAHRLELPLWNKSPDQYVSWKGPVLRAIDQYARSENYAPDSLVTFGYPMSDHLVGLELKKVFGVPWIAHFSDPWVGNIYTEVGHDRWTDARNRALERKVAETADRLIFTSQETVDMVMAKYSPEIRAKARVLPQSFDTASFAALQHEKNGLIIRHTGWFYGPRTPRPLFNALSAILSSSPALLAGVKLELIGDIDPKTIAESGLETLPADLISIKAPVDYSESLRLIAASDGLFLIDAPAEKSVFLPSKLVDYMGAGRPILGLTPPGAARSLIEQLGGWVASPDNLEEMTRSLHSFLSYLQEHKNAQREFWGDQKTREQYEAAVVAQTFAEILDELLPSSRLQQ